VRTTTWASGRTANERKGEEKKKVEKKKKWMDAVKTKK
jgi:hypothetical protein